LIAARARRGRHLADGRAGGAIALVKIELAASGPPMDRTDDGNMAGGTNGVSLVAGDSRTDRQAARSKTTNERLRGGEL